MKVELHCHTHLYSACAVEPPEMLLPAFVRAGYQAVYLTEHDAVWPEGHLADLGRRFPEIRVFGGVEREIRDDHVQHLLILGTSDPAYLAIPDAATLVEKARDEGRLTVLAHPFRWPGGDAMLHQGVRPDALEGRTSNQNAAGRRKSDKAARRLGLPVVNAGDVHSLDMIDRFWIDTTRPVEHPDDVRRIVLDRAYENRGADERRTP